MTDYERGYQEALKEPQKLLQAVLRNHGHHLHCRFIACTCGMSAELADVCGRIANYLMRRAELDKRSAQDSGKGQN